MKKIFHSFNAIVVLSILCIPAIFKTTNAEGKKSLSEWPRTENRINNIKILVAETAELAHQGFCNASSDDFQSTAIWFPDIKEGTMFVNTNPGFGTVNRDLKIVFLDRNWVVLEIQTMVKKKGTAIAPKNTYHAIEGIPEIINRLGFERGNPAPFRIIRIDGKYYCLSRQ